VTQSEVVSVISPLPGRSDQPGLAVAEAPQVGSKGGAIILEWVRSYTIPDT